MGVIDKLRASAASADWLRIPELPAWWRRSDKSAQRNAAASRAHPVLIWGCFLAAAGAGLVEAGFMALFVVRAVGDIDWVTHVSNGSGAPSVNDWAFTLTLHPLLFSLLFAASAIIVWFSLFWIPSQIALRGQGALRRLTMVAVGLFCNALIIVGSVIVQHENRVEDIRGAVVEEQRAAQGRAALGADLAVVQRDLDDLMGSDAIASPSYQMQACRAGAGAWAGYVRRAPAAGDGRLPQIERAQESAIRCDELRAARAVALRAVASAPVEAEVSVTVADEAGAGLATFTAFADAYRPVGIALALSLIGIMGAYWGFGLVQARALLDPAAPLREAEAGESISEPAPVAEPGGEATAADELVSRETLDLPVLPDLREINDVEFDTSTMTVDEHGHRLRRVAGSFRAERGAPHSRGDQRLAAAAEELAAVAAAGEGEPVASVDAAEGGMGDILDWAKQRVMGDPEAAAQERELAK